MPIVSKRDGGINKEKETQNELDDFKIGDLGGVTSFMRQVDPRGNETEVALYMN